jgi:hypothetical protein
LYALILLLGGEWVIKKPLIIISLVAFVALIAVYSFYPNEYQENLTKLEKTCAELTKNDPDGKVYEPIIGRYVTKKSYSASEQGGGGPERYMHQITLLEGDKEVTVHSKVMMQEEYNTEYLPLLKKVIDFPEWHGSTEYTDEIYGLCAFQGSSSKYVININTLTKIGE